MPRRIVISPKPSVATSPQIQSSALAASGAVRPARLAGWTMIVWTFGAPGVAAAALCTTSVRICWANWAPCGLMAPDTTILGSAGALVRSR